MRFVKLTRTMEFGGHRDVRVNFAGVSEFFDLNQSGKTFCRVVFVAGGEQILDVIESAAEIEEKLLKGMEVIR